jgi:hypothetical protein
VPDDAHAFVRTRRPEAAGRVGALQLRAGPGRVLDVPLRDGDLVEPLAVAERDLAEGAAEVARELEGDQLVDEQAAVLGDLDRDVGGRQRERLRGGVPGERERRESDCR